MNFKKFVLKIVCVIISMTIKLKIFDTDNILIDKKSHKNILIYDISCKTSNGAKHLRIRFDKIDGFIKIYNAIRYLVLHGPEKYDSIYNRIRYFIGPKSGITYIFSRYFPRIKVNSYDSLPIEKILTLHNVIIPIKLFLNKDKITATIRYFWRNARIS